MAGAENMERSRVFALLKNVGARGVTDLHTDPIQMLKGVLAQVAEHAQAAKGAVFTRIGRWCR
ncbi:MAG: hypothetical protein WA869_23685 [Alloacidobacterium sp.]